MTPARRRNLRRKARRFAGARCQTRLHRALRTVLIADRARKRDSNKETGR